MPKHNAQEWHLQDPSGQEWHFTNLRQFIRDNLTMFPEGVSVRTLASGLYRVRVNPGASSHGWKWAPYTGTPKPGHRKCKQCLQLKPSSAYSHGQRRCTVCISEMDNKAYKRHIRQSIETPVSMCVMCKVKMPRTEFDPRRKRCRKCRTLVPDNKYQTWLNRRAHRAKKQARVLCVTCGDNNVEAYAESNGSCCACADYAHFFPNLRTTLRDRRERHGSTLGARETRAFNTQLSQKDRELATVLLLRDNLI